MMSTINLALGQKFSVLIVNDDRIIRRIHKMLLTKFGFESHAVENGKEAVDLYISGKHFDLILMDMEMPVMDGPKATRELRSMGINNMIVGVTSRGSTSVKQAFTEAGLLSREVTELRNNHLFAKRACQEILTPCLKPILKKIEILE